MYSKWQSGRVSIPFGAFLLLALGMIMVVLAMFTSPAQRWLTSADPPVKISGSIVETNYQFACSDDASPVLASRICYGIRVRVDRSEKPAEVPVGTSVAVSTMDNRLAVGDHFSGATVGTSHRNLLNTLIILGVAFTACGVLGCVDHYRRSRLRGSIDS